MKERNKDRKETEMKNLKGGISAVKSIRSWGFPRDGRLGQMARMRGWWI